jgi:hypothetical protein
MKKIIPILIIVLVVIAGWLVLRFVIGGPEDTWICKDGEWVKHGRPSEPMPVGGCGEASQNGQMPLDPNVGGESIQSFDDCVTAGFPVMESYPRKCRDAEGNLFSEDIGNELDKADLIRLDNPRPNASIKSPLTIEGQARGNWFFEATFPVKLLDDDGRLVAEGYATAEGDWMTEDFVNFKAELSFTEPASVLGTLVLEKDNPSGLPENDDALRVPIIFEKSNQ